MVEAKIQESKPIFIGEAAQADAGTLTAKGQMTYAFAKQFGLLLKPAPSATHICYTLRKTPPAVLAEAQRFALKVGHKTPFIMQALAPSKFSNLLKETYEEASPIATALAENLDAAPGLKDIINDVPEAEDLLAQAGDAPIVRLINAMLTEAIREKASDVHLEVFDHDLVVRFRIDGVLQEVVRPNRTLASFLISRIKIMASMDIAEKRRPQDGRFMLRIADREVDVRVSTLPSGAGERVVMRILHRDADLLKLSRLGMTEAALVLTRSLLARPHGVFLVTGPTGSGKTTTLYASLSELDAANMNIMTVEDPVEYRLPGISQTQVNQKIGMTFSSGLRAMLRQDPDIIMVGEIRDTDSAQIAIQSSLTGHLVLATLHTNTAIGAVTRLLDMGVESFLLSSTLVGVLAQRLVRTLCTECKIIRAAEDFERRLLQIDEGIECKVADARGCAKCGDSGFKGRTGIYEMVLVDKTMAELIHKKASEADLQAYARSLTPSIRADGRTKVLAGLTSVREVLRVTMED